MIYHQYNILLDLDESKRRVNNIEVSVDSPISDVIRTLDSHYIVFVKPDSDMGSYVGKSRWGLNANQS